MMKACFLPLILSILLPTLKADQPQAARPNILVLLADNWAYPHAGILGDGTVRTPTFDSVCRRGTCFTHTFCQVPSCSPARAVLLTGQASHRLGPAANLWGDFPTQTATYPRILEKHGYHVGYSGKGWGPGLYNGKPHKQQNPAGRRYSDFTEFLDAQPADAPFCFWFGSTDPHQPWDKQNPYAKQLKNGDLHIPRPLPDVPAIREAIRGYYAEIQRFDAESGLILQTLKDRKQLANTLVLMLGDNGWQIPRGLANVYDHGTRVPLAVMWPTQLKSRPDNRALISFEDIGPTILEAAECPPLPHATGHSLLNLLKGQPASVEREAVFLERERHANVRADNRCYPMRAVRTHDYLYVHNLQPHLWPAGDPETHWAVGPFGDVDNTPFKEYILQYRNSSAVRPAFETGFLRRPEVELYDLRTDPDQLRNVADHPEYQSVVRELQTMLKTWMAETEDPRAADPNNVVFDNYPYYGGRSRLPDESIFAPRIRR